MNGVLHENYTSPGHITGMQAKYTKQSRLHSHLVFRVLCLTIAIAGHGTKHHHSCCRNSANRESTRLAAAISWLWLCSWTD